MGGGGGGVGETLRAQAPPSLFLLLFLPLRAQPALTICDAYRLVTCKTGELVAPACGQGSETIPSIKSFRGAVLPPVTVVWLVLDKVPSGASGAGTTPELPVPWREGLRACWKHVLPQLCAAARETRGASKQQQRGFQRALLLCRLHLGLTAGGVRQRGDIPKVMKQFARRARNRTPELGCANPGLKLLARQVCAGGREPESYTMWAKGRGRELSSGVVGEGQPRAFFCATVIPGRGGCFELWVRGWC